MSPSKNAVDVFRELVGARTLTRTGRSWRGCPSSSRPRSRPPSWALAARSRGNLAAARTDEARRGPSRRGAAPGARRRGGGGRACGARPGRRRRGGGGRGRPPGRRRARRRGAGSGRGGRRR
ncbi:hypothetical protein PVAP13_2NG554700 [Panicum virgatum]|uniref:Uncharacterized protein n=1 Tax=Panicum virgatum TaxID=38727 RepID=A0A8T0VRS4_PANVG|nr:hypothetical protein PVAP13_2NG554700 [Panicum virgatum]